MRACRKALQLTCPSNTCVRCCFFPQLGVRGAGWRRFDPAADKHIYALEISGVVPRCIAFVSSANRQQQANVAPFSYFSAMGHGAQELCFALPLGETNATENDCCADPPVLAIGLTTRNEVKNHTLQNIEETG